MEAENEQQLFQEQNLIDEQDPNAMPEIPGEVAIPFNEDNGEAPMQFSQEEI